jgi:hypothetical protein
LHCRFVDPSGGGNGHNKRSQYEEFAHKSPNPSSKHIFPPLKIDVSVKAGKALIQNMPAGAITAGQF